MDAASSAKSKFLEWVKAIAIMVCIPVAFAFIFLVIYPLAIFLEVTCYTRYEWTGISYGTYVFGKGQIIQLPSGVKASYGQPNGINQDFTLNRACKTIEFDFKNTIKSFDLPPNQEVKIEVIWKGKKHEHTFICN